MEKAENYGSKKNNQGNGIERYPYFLEPGIFHSWCKKQIEQSDYNYRDADRKEMIHNPTKILFPFNQGK